MPTVDQKALQQYARKIADQQIKVTIDGNQVEMSVRDYFRKQNEVNYAHLKAGLKAFAKNPNNSADLKALKEVCLGENKAISLEFIRAVEKECNKSAMQRNLEENAFGLTAGFIGFGVITALYTGVILTLLAPEVVAAVAAFLAISNPIGAAFAVAGLIFAGIAVLTGLTVFAAHKIHTTHVATDNAVIDMAADAAAHAKTAVQAQLDMKTTSEAINTGELYTSDAVQTAYLNTFGGVAGIKFQPGEEESLFTQAPVVDVKRNPLPTAGLFSPAELRSLQASERLQQQERARNRKVPTLPNFQLTNLNVTTEAVLDTFVEQCTQQHEVMSQANTAKQEVTAAEAQARQALVAQGKALGQFAEKTAGVIAAAAAPAPSATSKSCYCFLDTLSPRSDAGSATPVMSDREYSL